MTMPKTPLDKNYFLVLRKYDIWTSWKVFTMQAKPITHSV